MLQHILQNHPRIQPDLLVVVPFERSEDDIVVRAEVLDRRDLGLVTAVQTVNELVDEHGGDVPEQILNRLVLDLRVVDSDGALQNADTLRVLVEDGVDVLGLP